MKGERKAWQCASSKDETKTYEKFEMEVKMRFSSAEQGRIWLMKLHELRVTSSLSEYVQEFWAILSMCEPRSLQDNVYAFINGMLEEVS
jgi:Retrotransposon gag protein